MEGKGMSGPATFLSSLEGCGPEALEAFEAVIRSAGNLDVLPSDALIYEFEERVDLSADCHEIFDLAVNEIATRRMVPDGAVNGS